MTAADLETIMAFHPCLHVHGFGQDDRLPRAARIAKLHAQRRSLRGHLQMIDAAAKWLATLRQVKRPSVSSYYLKHRFENLTGVYCPTGVVVAAAFHLRLPYELAIGDIDIDLPFALAQFQREIQRPSPVTLDPC